MPDTPEPTGSMIAWAATAAAGAFAALWAWARGQSQARIEELKERTSELKKSQEELSNELKERAAVSSEQEKRLAAMEVRLEVTESANEVIRHGIKEQEKLAERAMEVSGKAIDFIGLARKEMGRDDE